MSWYRYQEHRYTDAQLMLVLSEFPVIRETKRGVWLDVYSMPRFVLLGARKRYACPTKDEALTSFHARKRRQAKILRAQLRQAETALALTCEGEMRYVPGR